jgi:hypothetical protein
MNKRALSFLLALTMLFSAVPAFAEEEDDEEWFETDDEESFEAEEDKKNLDTVSGYDTGESFKFGDFYYQFTEDKTGAILTQYSHNQRELVFPSEVDDGVPVVGIAIGLCACDPVIESLVIPGTVTAIPNRAFATCENLKTVVIQEGVKQLDMCCFGGCVNLEEIQFPESLEKIDNYAFAACGKLKEIRFSPKLTEIGDQAFYMCPELNKVVLPAGDAVRIGAMAFAECSADLQIVSE